MPLLKTIALNLSYVIWRNKMSQSTKQKIVRFQKWFGSGEGKNYDNKNILLGKCEE